MSFSGEECSNNVVSREDADSVSIEVTDVSIEVLVCLTKTITEESRSPSNRHDETQGNKCDTVQFPKFLFLHEVPRSILPVPDITTEECEA